MAFLSGVTTRFWDYVSPRKTQQRRDKEYKFKVPNLPQPRARKQQSAKTAAADVASMSSDDSALKMTPRTLVKHWDVDTTPVNGTEMLDPDLPPSPPMSLERAYTDFEGETLIDEMVSGLNPSSEAEWDANDDTLVVDEAHYVMEHKETDALDMRERQDAQGRELRAAGWTEDAIFLFQKLGLRGFEPLLPMDWVDDFRMLPLDLFTRNLDKAFVKPSSPELDYHAWRALEELFNLGGRTRDAVVQKAHMRTPEVHIAQAVRRYNKWALKDGKIENLGNRIPLFEVVSCPRTMDANQIQARMLRKLEKLADVWRNAFEERDYQITNGTSKQAAHLHPTPELPTLYGVAASHTIMAIVSYDPYAENPTLRTVSIFDMGKENYDVWNAFAVAIFVVHCRNRLLDLQDSLPTLAGGSISDNDPDA